ncbi:dihydrofolate reductase family protein [Gordonia hydrophobica]|uniref:Dihydrofolate reductase family protein n=1 Tax=Gordonia hydrophobica TaxID=40516 RepID=A0ABZ2U0D5_9ACTN|nr:dihydrofolate reductase family protein [Gordonia hydrophobica]MBM7367764.1 riboflavin biosynthesis pyrimidine reductase [Gordonia hydrophobica]
MQKATDVTAERLAQAYSFGPADRPVFRANMVSSIDGAATVDAKSGGLGGDGDHRIFHLQRSLADAIVVGAQTAVDEGYHPPSTPAEYAAARAARGQRPVPLLVLVTRSLSISPDSAATATTLADPNVLVATCRSAPEAARRRVLDAGATLIDCGDEDIDPHRLVDGLAARGVQHVLCEGGPRFLAAVTAADLLDELALTVSPQMTGGDAPRIAHGARPPGLRSMRLRHVIGDDDGFLFQLWERAVPRTSPDTR